MALRRRDDRGSDWAAEALVLPGLCSTARPASSSADVGSYSAPGHCADSSTPGYTTDILSDALLYADHSRAGGSAQGPSLDDVQLAIQAKVNHEFTQPMPKEVSELCASRLDVKRGGT
jgi:hypothetical protein